MAAPVQTSMMSPVLISMLRCTPANQVLITPFDLFSWGGRIRTCECRYQKPMAYHLPTPQNVRLAGALGLEPRTFGTRTHCATNCAIPQNAKNLGVAHVRGSLRAVSGQCTSPARVYSSRLRLLLLLESHRNPWCSCLEAASQGRSGGLQSSRSEEGSSTERLDQFLTGIQRPFRCSHLPP